jgi:hypothetical protein
MDPVEQWAILLVRCATKQSPNGLHEAQEGSDAAQYRMGIVHAGPASNSQEDENESGNRQPPRSDHEALVELKPMNI